MNKYTIPSIFADVDDFYHVIFENCYVELVLRFELTKKMRTECVKLTALLSILKNRNRFD